MSDRQENTLLVEGAEIRWRNFTGEVRRYNNEGKRNFCLFLPEETAMKILADGWPVKMLEPREEGEERKYFVKVNIKLGGKRPPTIVMITHRGRTELPDEIVQTLDYVWIKNVDLVVRSHDWSFDGNSGTNVYLNAIYVTLEENPHEVLLEERYGDIPVVDLTDDVEQPEETPF